MSSLSGMMGFRMPSLFGSRSLEEEKEEEKQSEVLESTVENSSPDKNGEAISAETDNSVIQDTTEEQQIDSSKGGTMASENGSPPSERKDLESDSDSEDGFEIADKPIKNLANMSTTRPEAFDNGYDSDGGTAPPNRTREEEAMLEKERTLGEEPPPPPAAEVQVAEDEEEPPNAPVTIPEQTLKTLTVPLMKEEMTIRNVPFSNRLKRPELLDRLRQSLHLPVVLSRPKKKSKKKTDNKKKKEKIDDLSDFAPGAYWRVLNPKQEAVKEPDDPTFDTPRAPTVPEADASKPQATKHDFADTFDRPTFKGTKKIPKLNERTGKAIIGHDGNVLCEDVIRTKGGPKIEFMKKHGLTKDSHPVEFFEAFFPVKNNQYKNSNNEQFLSVAQCQQWTNMKALLANAGTEDCYRDFTPFTIKEIEQHLGLLILNGLSPSPSIDLKFDPSDEANYNHFVHQCMPNGLRRHRHFRAFFAVQDPRKPVPRKKNVPLFKLLPLINWINKIGHTSWDLSIDLSIDEQTISFQGRHFQKLRITYKAEGDGFQCDALCDMGFTHSVYFRNEPPPTKCTKQGFSPLHARVVWLFDRLEDEYHNVWMDNLYTSARLAKSAFKHKKKVGISGVGCIDGNFHLFAKHASVLESEA